MPVGPLTVYDEVSLEFSRKAYDLEGHGGAR